MAGSTTCESMTATATRPRPGCRCARASRRPATRPRCRRLEAGQPVLEIRDAMRGIAVVGSLRLVRREIKARASFPVNCQISQSPASRKRSVLCQTRCLLRELRCLGEHPLAGDLATEIGQEFAAGTVDASAWRGQRRASRASRRRGAPPDTALKAGCRGLRRHRRGCGEAEADAGDVRRRPNRSRMIWAASR